MIGLKQLATKIFVAINSFESAKANYYFYSRQIDTLGYSPAKASHAIGYSVSHVLRHRTSPEHTGIGTSGS
jgi:hypothetical protein